MQKNGKCVANLICIKIGVWLYYNEISVKRLNINILFCVILTYLDFYLCIVSQYLLNFFIKL